MITIILLFAMLLPAQLRCMESKGSLSSSSVTPSISSSSLALDPDLKVLGDAMLYETKSSSEILSCLRQRLVNTENKIKTIKEELNYCIRNRKIKLLGEIAEATMIRSLPGDELIAKVSFDALKDIYNQCRYDLEIELYKAHLLVKVYLAKIIVSQSKYINTDLLNFEAFSHSQVLSMLYNYERMRKGYHIYDFLLASWPEEHPFRAQIAIYNKIIADKATAQKRENFDRYQKYFIAKGYSVCYSRCIARILS